ncbi:MAG: YeeE/YedE family protein [Bacteroidetes bacterium]|nr:YeeE/YedE family protein [Bacteroidota bacterium]
MNKVLYLLFGVAFGIVLTKAEVVSWFRIQDMFQFKELHMYLIIGSAVAVGIVSMQIVRRLKLKSLSGEELKFQGKPFHKGFIIGGMMFGFGWAITGACPGPIFAQIGAGEMPAFFTLAGALSGAFLYHSVKGKLPQ